MTTLKPANKQGSVVFVGTGPGDPGLLTVRALDELSSAEVVVLDRAATDPRRQNLLSKFCPERVEVVDAGFGENGQPLTHAGRAKLITNAAKAGSRVVRLLDGDGTMFGGLAEEMQACVKAGLAFEVVPGVSLATAVPAFAGVPATSSEVNTVHVVDAATGFDAGALVDPQSSVVLVGQPHDLVTATQMLLHAGREADTPAVLTVQGTTIQQRSVSVPLHTVCDAIDELTDDDASYPVVVFVGPTAALRERVSWFETKPLFGWRVLVPRTQAQSAPMTERLGRYGAEVDLVPTISVEPPRTPHQMDKAITGLVTGRYEWVGFTSVNAVRAVREKFEQYGLDARAFAGLKVAAVGGVTAAALEEWGIRPDLVPTQEFSARGLLEVWPPFDDAVDPINRVFLPRADIATDTLVAGLQEIGWEVDDVTAYRTVRASPPPVEVRDAIKAGQFDAVVFTSSSTVRNLIGIAGKPHTATVVACIGPATAKTAEEHGLRVDVLAAEATSQAVVDALAEFGTGLRQAAAEAGEPVVRPSQKVPASRRRAR